MDTQGRLKGLEHPWICGDRVEGVVLEPIPWRYQGTTACGKNCLKSQCGNSSSLFWMLVRWLGRYQYLSTFYTCVSDDKESRCQCRKPEFSPWVEKIPWRRAWQPTSVFFLAWRVPMDRGAWRTTVHRVTKSQTRLKWLSIAQDRK